MNKNYVVTPAFFFSLQYQSLFFKSTVASFEQSFNTKQKPTFHTNFNLCAFIQYHIKIKLIQQLPSEKYAVFDTMVDFCTTNCCSQCSLVWLFTLLRKMDNELLCVGQELLGRVCPSSCLGTNLQHILNNVTSVNWRLIENNVLLTSPIVFLFFRLFSKR